MSREWNTSKAFAGLQRRVLLGLILLLIGGTVVSASRAKWTAPRGGVALVQAFSVTGGSPSPSDNDYTRINDAVQTAENGLIISLEGTFDWTEPNAAASWARGSDGVASTVNDFRTTDDFSITVPAGLNGLTLTAASLGAATIEGPGDLAAVDLESFLKFLGGPNHNCTFSNLRIRNFDVGIAMLSGAGGDGAFSGTVITNNYVLVPADLNSVAAPLDFILNIGILCTVGANQTISNNTVEIAGNGFSDAPNHVNSASIGMMLNTIGRFAYDGLLIDNNTIRVLNAQSANPELIRGFWDAGFAHDSSITISNNSFVNVAAGNDPALNREAAFRISSHSSRISVTSVVYSGNTVNGANVGFEWDTGEQYRGRQPVELLGNTVTNCFTGVLIQSEGVAHLTNNRLTGPGSTGTGVSILSNSTATIDGALGSNTISLFNTGIAASGNALIVRNSITGNTTGVAIGNPTPGVALSFNRIVGNGEGMTSAGPGLVLAENNWWGCNAGPGGSGCGTVTGNVDFNPWLVLGISATPSSLSSGQTSTVIAKLSINSDGIDTSGLGVVPDGIPVGFATTPLGSIAPPFATTSSGMASAVFTAGPLSGIATVSATVDGQSVTTPITIVGGRTLFCIQDDSSGDVTTIDMATGNYTFRKCSTGVTVTGRGIITIRGCSTRLEQNGPDKRVLVSVDTCAKRATATIQTFGPSRLFTIADRNTANNTCMCPF